MRRAKDGDTELSKAIHGTGCTHAEIADYLHITSVSMSNKMRGKTQFTVEEMWSIADYLGFDEKEMLRLFPKGGVKKAVGKFHKSKPIRAGVVVDAFKRQMYKEEFLPD